MPEIKLIYEKLSEADVPLFVPTMIKDDRDRLRRHLIDKKIYCPIHWPISEYHYGISDLSKKIYEEELSLVCDQRYTEEDMNRIVYEIKAYISR